MGQPHRHKSTVDKLRPLDTRVQTPTKESSSVRLRNHACLYLSRGAPLFGEHFGAPKASDEHAGREGGTFRPSSDGKLSPCPVMRSVSLFSFGCPFVRPKHVVVPPFQTTGARAQYLAPILSREWLAPMIPQYPEACTYQTGFRLCTSVSPLSSPTTTLPSSRLLSTILRTCSISRSSTSCSTMP